MYLKIGTGILATALSLFIALCVILLLAATGPHVHAQDLGIITATVGPDDATPQATTVPSSTDNPVAAPALPLLTQTDLSILTGNVQRPNGMTWFNGKLYVSCTGDWTLYQLDSASGQTFAYIYGVRNAHSLHAEEEANGELALWIPDFQSNSLAKVTRRGVQTVIKDLQGPWGIAALDDDEFLVTNLLGDTVEDISRDGKRRTTIADLTAPTGIVVDGSMVYVANNGSTRRAIEWYDLSNMDRNSRPKDKLNHVLVSGIQNPTGLVLGPDGYLYMAYSIGTRGVVGRVDPDECKANGGCVREDVQIVIQTELAAPLAGLTISPDMRLFIHTMFSPDIYWVQL